jgi:hypothetical protein
MLVFSASYSYFSLVIVVRQKRRSKSTALNKAHNYLRPAQCLAANGRVTGSLVIVQDLKNGVSARYILMSIYVSGGKNRQINPTPHHT